ncbi:MAG: hypothetical protein AB7S41_10100 [Parvibaculaceae bacterium]
MTELKTNEARQGSTPHVVRYVLGWSVALACVGMLLAWVYFGS